MTFRAVDTVGYISLRNIRVSHFYDHPWSISRGRDDESAILHFGVGARRDVHNHVVEKKVEHPDAWVCRGNSVSAVPRGMR